MDKVFVTQAAISEALAKTQHLCHELDITNADHIALWLEANTLQDEPMGQCVSWLACRIVEAYERAIAAQQQVEPVTVWQPIETAPKDGSYVDLWCAPLSDGGAVLLPCRLPNCYWVSDYNSWYMSVARGEPIKVWHRVTHWMPLPAAPEKDV